MQDNSASAGGGAGAAALNKECKADQLILITQPLVWTLDGFNALFQGAISMVRMAVRAAQIATLGLIPWLDDVEKAIDAFGKGLDKFIQEVKKKIDGLDGPWQIKCVGEKIKDGMGAVAEEFATTIDPKGLKSKESWKGDAANKFRTNADAQKKAADEAAKGVKTLGEKMISLGNVGIAATVAFLFAMVILTIKITVAIAKLPAVPIGTLIGKVELWTCVAECLALIAAFTAFILATVSQADAFRDAVDEVPMGGKWPVPGQ